MRKSNISIGIDMDMVLADLNRNWTRRIEKEVGQYVKPEDITDWHMAQFFKCGAKIFDFLDYDLFRHLPVMEDSQEVVKELCEYYRVYIVTSATSRPDMMVAKWEWLDEHFPFIPKDQIIMCGKKDMIGTNALIDDAPHNLESFQGPCKILFNQPYNQNEQRFIRANNWQHVHKMFLGK